MLFSDELTAKILKHGKTETCRLVQRGTDGALYKPCWYRPGRDYPLERRMRRSEADHIQLKRIESGKGRPVKKEVGRLLITDVVREPLGEITFDTARAEGFKTPTEFKAFWVRLHDSQWIERQEVITDEDGVVNVDRHLTDEDLAARFHDRWADGAAAQAGLRGPSGGRLVYVIRFRLLPATRYLGERGNGDYVTTERDQQGRRIAMTTTVDPAANPTITDHLVRYGQLLLAPEEAVDPDLIDVWWHDTNSTHQQIKQDIREGLKTGAHYRAEERQDTVDRRVELACERGRLHGIETKPQVWLIKQAQRRKRKPEHIENLVADLERAVDRNEDLV